MLRCCRVSPAIPALVAVAVVVACGPAGRGQQPSWRKPPKMASSTGVAQVIEFAPVHAAATRYNDPPITPAPPSRLGDAITTAVGKVSTQLGKPAPQPDGRLFAAAQALAEVAPENAPLAYSMVEFAMQWNGIIEPSPHLVVIWGPADEPGPIMDKLSRRLPDILGATDFARLGVGSSTRSGGEAVTVLAFQSSFIETKPIPRELPDGGTINLSGQVTEPFNGPQVYVTREDGDVELPDMVRQGSKGFKASVSCDGRRGRQQIEITATDATGSTVMANFPVWCNERAPEKIVVLPTEDDTTPVKTGEEAERRMVELLEQDRARKGLSNLELDPELSAVARAHSFDMRETGVVAHISENTGSAIDRVRAAKIRSALVLENVARAYGVAEAEHGLMNSPGHRANILSDKPTHLGVGIVLGEEVAGRRELFITQLFIRRPTDINLSQARSAAKKAVLDARSLTEDRRLSKVAKDFAASVAGGESTEKAANRSASRLKKMRTTFASVTTLVTTVADVEAFEPKSALGDPDVSHFGIGVARGDHDVMGEDAIYIVVLLAKD